VEKVGGINLNQVLLMGLDFSSGPMREKQREKKKRFSSHGRPLIGVSRTTAAAAAV